MHTKLKKKSRVREIDLEKSVLLEIQHSSLVWLTIISPAKKKGGFVDETYLAEMWVKQEGEYKMVLNRFKTAKIKGGRLKTS